MSSKLSLIALGAGVYLAVAIVSFPAAVAYRWFAPDEIALAVVEGTIWQGTAEFGGVAGFGFSDLRWQLHPVPLLAGRISLSAEIGLPDGFARTELTAAGNRLELRDLSAGTNLAVFRTLLPLGEVAGQISVSMDRIELVDGWPVAAAGEVRIAGLAAPPLLPVQGVSRVELGNFAARFEATGEPGIAATLGDQGGPIELRGRLRLTPDRRYLIDAELRARADAPAYLVQGIELLPVAPNADGMRSFRLEDML